MKTKDVKTLARGIYRTFSGNEVRLVDYIAQNFDWLTSPLIGFPDKEKLAESLIYEYSTEFGSLLEHLKREIASTRPSNRVEVREDLTGVHVSLSFLGREARQDIESEYYRYFQMMESLDKMEKGIIYEKFCALFLSDLGLEAENTPPSNDKGIDIIAKYRTTLSEEKSRLVFDDYVYLIGQAKFLNTKVDTPIIRRLVGDSLFIRFNQLEYVELSHNAIHQIVFSHSGFTEAAIDFCKTNKIMRIETSQMVTILSSKAEPASAKSLLYLRKRFS